jgi:hypothetical protein
MPRIGGGGGAPPPQGPMGPGGANQAGKADFANSVAKAQSAAPAAPAAQAAPASQARGAQQSQLSGKAREIAKRFASGNLERKEAFREFVGLVIEERFPHFKRKKKNKKQQDKDDEGESQDGLEDAVTELIDRDPALAKRLSSQFQKLAKQG